MNYRISVVHAFFEYVGGGIRGARSIVQAMRTVLPYWIYFRSGELRKEVTEQYPDPVSSRGPEDLPPRFRGLLLNDLNVCTGCGDCTQICPVSCIDLKTRTVPGHSKLMIDRFRIDYSKCIFCGLCVESCVPASLVHRREFEVAVENKKSLERDAHTQRGGRS